jgi:hypothetical protein
MAETGSGERANGDPRVALAFELGPPPERVLAYMCIDNATCMPEGVLSKSKAHSHSQWPDYGSHRSGFDFPFLSHI